MNRRIAIGVFLVLAALGAAVLMVTQKTTAPSLNISFLHYEQHRKDTYAVVEIRNTGSGTACFYGYGGESPFYRVMAESSTGWINTPNQFWCGTGAEPGFIPPGGAKQVRVYLPTNQTWKVGISFWKPGLEDRLPRFAAERLPSTFQSQRPVFTVWSPPIPFRPVQ